MHAQDNPMRTSPTLYRSRAIMPHEDLRVNGEGKRVPNQELGYTEPISKEKNAGNNIGVYRWIDGR